MSSVVGSVGGGADEEDINEKFAALTSQMTVMTNKIASLETMISENQRKEIAIAAGDGQTIKSGTAQTPSQSNNRSNPPASVTAFTLRGHGLLYDIYILPKTFEPSGHDGSTHEMVITIDGQATTFTFSYGYDGGVCVGFCGFLQESKLVKDTTNGVINYRSQSTKSTEVYTANQGTSSTHNHVTFQSSGPGYLRDRSVLTYPVVCVPLTIPIEFNSSISLVFKKYWPQYNSDVYQWRCSYTML